MKTFILILFFSICLKQFANAQMSKLEKDRAERTYYQALSREEKIEYKRKKKTDIELLEKENKRKLYDENMKNYRKFGKNIFTIMPFSIMSPNAAYEMFFRSSRNIGLSYERILAPMLSVKLPVTLFSFDSTNYQYAGVQLKYYSSQGDIKFAVGPQLNLAYSNVEDYFYNENGFTEIQRGKRYTMSIYSMASINITITKNIFIGFEQGFGFEFYMKNKFKQEEDQNVHYKDYSDQYIKKYSNFLFNTFVGYRF